MHPRRLRAWAACLYLFLHTMGDAPGKLRRIVFAAAVGGRMGAVLGLWVGLIDGALALHRMPELAGPWMDRVLTLLVAMATSAVFVALLGLTAGAVQSLFHDTAQRPATGRYEIAAMIGAPVFALLLASIGWPGPPAHAASDPRPNLILVSIDTLRPDHLGAYGYERDTSPHLDALAREGVIFDAAYSHSSWTLPSHASMFTSLDPIAHGVLTDRDRLDDAYTTVAEILHEAGYWTGAWVGTDTYGYAGNLYRLDQGFELYEHRTTPRRYWMGFLPQILERRYRHHITRWLANGELQIDSVIRWLGTARHEPFFLFVHLYDVHSRFEGRAYRAPPPYFDKFCKGELFEYTGCRDGLCASELLGAVTAGRLSDPDESEMRKLVCLYDGGIAFTDAQLGRLFAALEGQRLTDRTAILVTADHGEAFFEHGTPLHSTLHQEITHVPLIARVPGVAAGKRARGQVRHIDLMPTLLEIAGARVPEHLQGRSLLETLRSWQAEVDEPVFSIDRSKHSTSLRRGPFHVIHNADGRNAVRPTPDELYDVARDASEQSNLARYERETFATMSEQLERQRAESNELQRRITGSDSANPVELSADERAQLEALGYTSDPSH